MRVVSLFLDKNHITGLTSEGVSARFWARLVSKWQGNESRSKTASRLESLSPIIRAGFPPQPYYFFLIDKIGSNFQPIFISRGGGPTIDHHQEETRRIIFIFGAVPRDHSLDDVLFLAHMRESKYYWKNIEGWRVEKDEKKK